MSPMAVALIGFLVICIGTAGVLAAATMLYRRLASRSPRVWRPRTAPAQLGRTDVPEKAPRHAGTPAWQTFAAHARSHAAVSWRPAGRRRVHS